MERTIATPTFCVRCLAPRHLAFVRRVAVESSDDTVAVALCESCAREYRDDAERELALFAAARAAFRDD